MERVIHYLAEELKKQEATKARKDGKKARVATMLKNLTEQQSGPLGDLLTVPFPRN